MKKHKGDCGSPICKECCESEEEYNKKLKEYFEWLKNGWE